MYCRKKEDKFGKVKTLLIIKNQFNSENKTLVNNLTWTNQVLNKLILNKLVNDGCSKKLKIELK